MHEDDLPSSPAPPPPLHPGMAVEWYPSPLRVYLSSLPSSSFPLANPHVSSLLLEGWGKEGFSCAAVRQVF